MTTQTVEHAPLPPARRTSAEQRQQVMGVLGALAAMAGAVLVAWLWTSADVAQAALRSAQPQWAHTRAQAAAFEGRLDVFTDPGGALVFVDGVYVGKSPVRAVSMRASVARVELRRPGYESVHKAVERGGSSEHLRLQVTLRPTR